MLFIWLVIRVMRLYRIDLQFIRWIMLIHAPPHVEIDSRFHWKAVVYFLVAVFGLGTWTNLSGIWIELPIIVPILPESWQLPAKLTLLINSANIFPILIVFTSLIFKLNTAPFEVPVNFILLCTSITFAVGFAFLWDKTAYLFGTEQSVYLMLLCFCSAVADCLSSTTFIPFLHRYESIYLNAYFIGEALTALLPALLGMAQGIGTPECVLFGNRTEVYYHQPRFSVRIYFLLLSFLPFAALLAFASLQRMKTGRLKKQPSTAKSKMHQSRVFILMDNIRDINLIENTIRTINRIESQFQPKPTPNRLKELLLSKSGIYLFIIFQTSAMLYGICQGLITFSLNAYSITTFHYTIIASQFAYPIVSLIGAFIPEVSSKIIYSLYAMSTGLFVYIFITAKLSPCPPLVNQTLGHVIIFFTWISIYLTCSYIRVLMGNYFRKTLGHHGLVWFSVATQIGALIGSLFTFILTTNSHFFQERNICDKTLECL